MLVNKVSTLGLWILGSLYLAEEDLAFLKLLDQSNLCVTGSSDQQLKADIEHHE